MFEKHQLLIPLLIELVLETEQGKVDDKEVGILCRSLGGLAAQLECEEMGSKNVTLYRKPDWVTDRVSTIYRHDSYTKYKKVNFCEN